MTGFDERDREQPAPADHETSRHAHGRHHALMMLCCLPMVAIVVLLVATGTATAGTLFAPIACVVMMAVMMAFMMPGGRAR